MTRYIPPNDADFLAWMNNFISVLNANLATFGLVAADLTPLTNARNDFQTKLGNFQTAEAAFRAASEAKKTSRNAAEPLVYRFHVALIRHGRAVCRAQNPRCAQCPLQDLCAYRQATAGAASG